MINISDRFYILYLIKCHKPKCWLECISVHSLWVRAYHITYYNATTQNNCFVKGSHKCDVYLRDKHKAHVNWPNKDRISIFIYRNVILRANVTLKERYVMSSGAMLKQRHANKQKDDFSFVLQNVSTKGRFHKICLRKNRCGCWQNKQNGGLQTLSLRRKTR